MRKENNKIKFALSNFFIILLSFLYIFAFRADEAGSVLTNYTDPPGYPASWPGALTTYTYQGGAASDNTGGSGGDTTTGGTNPSGNVDFSQGSVPAAFFSGDGSVFFIRYRLNGPPLALTSNEPVVQATWNLLIDTDGDGFKEFVVMLDGDQNASPSNSSPDDLVVIYDNNPRQDWDINAAGIWRQDSAKHKTSPNNVDGEVSGGTDLINWDRDSSQYVWDFGRIRVTQIDQTGNAGKNNSEYFLDIQVPVSAFDASGIGGPTLTPSSRFSVAATTSNSNSNPTQKDALFNGPAGCSYTMCPTCPIPVGDTIDFYGNTYQAPTITTVSATSCPSPLTFSTTVTDAQYLNSSCSVVDSIVSVKFYYYLDTNNNNIADDGNTWIYAGEGSPTSTLGVFNLSFNANLIPNGHYLVKSVAKDEQGNTTDSTNQPNPPSLSGLDIHAQFNNTCGGATGIDYGDAPTSFGTSGASAPKHTVYPELKLGGSSGDNESNGQPNATATGDDANTSDDEDGVVFTNIGFYDTSYTASVTVTNFRGLTANVRGWIDFDGSGIFEDDEASDLLSVPNGTSGVTYNLVWSSIPSDITSGTRFARVRLSTDSLAVSDDLFTKSDGEIEDYQVTIDSGSTDRGDAPISYGALVLHNRSGSEVHLGESTSTVDNDNTYPTGSFGDADDNTNVDDEDGVIVLNPLTTSTTPYNYSVNVRVTNNTGGTVHLRGWLDYKNGNAVGVDGTFDDSGEASSLVSFSTAGTSTQTLTWTGIEGIPTSGSTYLRIRVTTSASSLSSVNDYNNTKTKGEVEDYQVPITAVKDYGDAPNTYGTLESSYGASHNVSSNLKIGTNAADSDANGFGDGIDNNANATDDDANGTDDEDSISSFPTLSTGTLSYSINATNVSNSTGLPANLRAWIDFDRNGVFDDDEASSLVSVPTGTSNQTFAITWSSLPNDTQAGTTYARVRITTDNLGVTQDIGNKLDGEVEDYQLSIIQSADYGDAPNTYLTTNASGGPKHKLPSSNLYLGTNLTDENTDGPSSGTGIEDDSTTAPSIDDEDSISTFPDLTNASKTYSLSIKATNTTGVDANLRGWIDFDGNGVFDNDESATISVPTGTSGSNVTLTWSTVPSDITIGSSYLRLRYSTDAISATDVGGEKSNGEVEDYPLSIIQGTDFGDNPDAFKTLNASGGAKHNITRSLYMGTTWADHESDGQPNVASNGDDTNGYDDEESISSFPTLATYMLTYSVSSNITNTSGANAYARAWIDFDGNNLFDDDEASDLITIPNNTNNVTTNITWSTIPSDISVGATRYVRVRLSTQTLTVSDDIGLKLGGEVEDYSLSIVQQTDYGDLPDAYKTLSASNGARHTLTRGVYLGVNSDGESNGQPNVAADGDDTNNLDDEDGVIFNPSIYPGLLHIGQTNSIGVNASTNGFVSMWIDYNNDGDFADTGEQILNDSSVVSGSNTKTFTIANNLNYEYKYIRVRFATTAGIANTPTGLASNGEVEDYRVYLASYPHECSTYTNSTGMIGNGSFEDSPSVTTYIQTNENNIPYWNTTAVGNLIEIWKSGYNGVPSHTFNQFAELNADEPSALYQDVITTPGATVNLRVSHRGRAGTDVATVKVGDPNGTLSILGTMTDGTTAWGEYSYSYVVPAGQTVTRLQFEATSAAGGLTIGNFIDSVVAFSTVPCSIPQDYGDAPDTYKTLSSSSGAVHKYPMNPLKLGANNGDVESDGQPNVNADGDDLNTIDDEDGVTSFPSITNNLTTYSVNVTASNAIGIDANIRGWIDFDGNGTFDDDEASGLQTITGSSSNVSRTLTWTIPSDIVVGNHYVRVRISTDSLGVADDISLKTNGEVEDYVITVQQATDYGDAPDTYGTSSSLTAAKHNIVSNLKMGTNAPDHEATGSASGTGIQDDSTTAPSIDDEDGVSSFSTLLSNASTYSVTINNVTNSTGSPANLRGWIDFDGSGTFDNDEASDLTATNVPNGTNGNVTITWSSIPSDTIAGSTYIRLRLTTDSLAITDDIGGKTNGEVEDHSITITQATDFGDAPSSYSTTTTHHNIVSNLKMGTNAPDHEVTGPASGTGIQDDSTTAPSIDDEDGVSSFNILSNNLTSYSVVVNTTNLTGTDANLRGWIDFDNSGTFDNDEASDLTSANVPNGTNGNITITWSSIPADISIGTRYIRIRLTTDTLALTDDVGTKNSGEIEDYQISIIQGIDYGDAPSSYSTTTTSHNITNNLKLGTNAGDHDVTPPASGTGTQDDTTDIDDEDSVAMFNILNTSDTSYSVTVNVTNSIGSTANLRGWIDFDRNGTFDSDEASSLVTVNTGTSANRTLTWSSIPSDISMGSSYVRIRLTTGTLGTSNATGTRTNGEIEDYQLSIGVPAVISGKVFEDINYGGGAGRSLAAASGIVRPDVRVELYNSSGSFVSATTTNASGLYSFTVSSGNYTVRVVNRTVSSSRTGGCSVPVDTATCTQIPVQTFRTNASSGSAVAVTNRVGGQNPALQDPLNGASGTTLNTTTGVFSTGLTGTAQSITNVTVGASDITDLDFGFNFDTIVNTNDSEQGSLRQFVVNSNALSNTGLAQVGQTAGKEVSIFMIPNGVANAGQNTSYANQLTTYGAGRIVLATALPNITDLNTIIDGRTQTNNVKTATGSQTNEGQIGSGGIVGVSQTSLPKFDKTEVEIHATNIRAIIANTTATNFELRSIALSNTGAIINGNGSLIQDTLVGMASNGDETGATYSNTYCLTVGPNTSNMTVRHNYVKCDNSGIRRDTDGSNMLVEYNEVDRPSAGQSNTYEAFLIIGAGLNDTAQYNLFKNMRGAGSELGYNPNAQVVNLQIKENTYQDNGKNIDGTPSNEPLGIIVRTIGSNSVLKIYRNIIARNGATGILVQNTNRVWITQNSIFENGPAGSLFGSTANLGIDLRTGDVDPNTMSTNIDGVTPNNGTTSSTEANNGTDYPIITSALLKNGTLRVKGYVGTAPDQAPFANSTLEFFKAADDSNNNGQVIQGDGLNVPHGEGKVFVDTCDTTSNGTFDCTFYNVKSIAPGEYLTATATNTNKDTSEFSNLKIVTEEPFLFYPDNFSNALPGAVIYYTHEVVTPRAGNVTLSTTTDKGWTYLFFNDVNGNSLLDSGDTPYSGGSNPNLGDIYNLNPSHSVKLIVKVQIPAGTPMGTVDTFNITATLTPTDTNYAPSTLTVKDITTVSNVSSGQLKLVKAVSPTGPQKPGTDLTYTITYTNIGSEPLSSVVINDIVPNSTTFVSVSSGGTYDPVTRKVRWSISGSVMPGVTGFVQFVVKIN